MTRDEHRAQCIEAMAIAILPLVSGKGAVLWKPDGLSIQVATAAFDSLHGIAFVNPIEATGEMIAALWKFGPVDTVFAKRDWRAMAERGNLTNPPEKKPRAIYDHERGEY